jgi:crotonobetainyl-CoA:carnitine CoA-transferase CaiB-like acyl-CoA transferase
MPAPLEGIHVTEVGGAAAVAYAGKLFADLGAEVTRVESGGATSQLFARSHVVFCGSIESAAAFQDDAEAIAREHAHLVVVSVTPFGLRSEARRWAADDLTLQAFGGISIGVGLPDRAPLKLPGDQTAYQAGVSAAIAAMGALFSTQGALVDVAAADVWAAFYSGVDVALAHFGRHKKVRAGHRVAGQPYPRTIYRCKDGYFAIQCGESRHWRGFLEMIAREDLADHALFANRFKANDEHGDACDAMIEPWFLERTKDEILKACLDHKIPGAPVYDIGEVAAHPHLRERGYFAKGNIYASMQAVRPERSAAESKHERPEGLGRRAQDEIKAKLRPLAGLRVVDFGWVWAGAVPGHVLADMGAEVIKVESASPLDYMRQGRPIVGTEKDPEQNPMFQNVNHGKLSLRAKLDHPAAKALLTDLIGASDVVIENFSPGVMEKFGLSYEDLTRVRPDLVMCSMSAVGQKGPLRRIRTYATMIASLAGLDGLVAYPGGRVLGSQSSYADPNASLHAVLGILAALWWRNETGEGAYIDLSQWEAAVNVMGEQLAEYALHGRVPAARGTEHPDKAPHGHYRAAGDDRWIAISVADDRQWHALKSVLREPEWMSLNAFATLNNRRAHRDELDRRLGNETARHEANTLASALASAGVPAAPLLDPCGIAASPRFRERQLFESIEHPVLGELPVYRLPWHIDGAAIPITRRAPLLGEHNDYVLTEVLGYAVDRRAALQSSGVFS